MSLEPSPGCRCKADPSLSPIQSEQFCKVYMCIQNRCLQIVQVNRDIAWVALIAWGVDDFCRMPPNGKKRNCRFCLGSKPKRKISVGTVGLCSPALDTGMIIIRVAFCAQTKIFRRVLHCVEFHSKNVGNAAIAHSALATTQREARERQVGIVDDKGESISTLPGSFGDLPVKRRFKATLNLLLLNEPGSTSLARFLNRQTQPVFKQYRIVHQVEAGEGSLCLCRLGSIAAHQDEQTNQRNEHR